MPAECLPVEGNPRGRLSYTITNESSGAKIEVLLKAKAFRIVKIARFSKTGHLDSLVFPFKYHILAFDTTSPQQSLTNCSQIERDFIVSFQMIWHMFPTPSVTTAKVIQLTSHPWNNVLGTMTSRMRGVSSRSCQGGGTRAQVPVPTLRSWFLSWMMGVAWCGHATFCGQ